MRFIKSILVTGACMTSACSSMSPDYRVNSVDYADDVGTVTISPVSVSRWEKVAPQLKPAFKMDATTALAQSMPVGQTLTEKLIEKIAVNAGLSLPTTSATNITGYITNAETSERQSIDSETVVQEEGVLSRIPDVSLSPLADLAIASPTAQIDNDPMLKYLAATALLQEVRMLNRYVDDVVKVENGQAFLVRFQLAMLPNARNMPYDVVTDITLHADDVQADAGFWKQDDEVGSPASCGSSFDRVHVMPMIVTDNLENLRASRSSDQARQIGLALLATAQGVGARGQVNSLMRLLSQIEGQDANSLLTVSRLSDSTVRVRLGAALSPQSQYSTVARNHNVSLMVIYEPCEGAGVKKVDVDRVITAVARSSFYDARTGTKLPNRDTRVELNRKATQFRDKYAGDPSLLELAALYRAAMRQDWNSFRSYYTSKYEASGLCDFKQLAKLYYGLRYGGDLDADVTGYHGVGENGEMPPALLGAASRTENLTDPCAYLNALRYEAIAAGLFTDLIGVRPTGEFAFARIPVQLRAPGMALPPVQSPLLETSEKASVVTLYGGSDLDLMKDLKISLTSGATTLIPSAVSVSNDEEQLTASFRSIKLYGWDEKATPVLRLSSGELSQEYKPVIVSKKDEAQAPGFTMKTGAKAIVYQANARGTVLLQIAPARDVDGRTIKSLQVSGGDAIALEGIERTSSGFKVGQTGEVRVGLANLVPNQIVEITLTDDKGGATKLSLPVLAIATDKKSD
ncbi:MAG: hypothetical protein JJ901_06020 [Erythrobacter sp.]|uniref:hypothetical protein n=1 Tax=Erythrobacter sp. TaxID=1042 RepID=UPI001B15635B|nr:hypothetical protein [Erythrobacter sp.]MBO6767844.1 hypothetical protein [Erythrobacter sp.]